MSVPDAGKLYFGLGRNGSYDAAKAGLIPTIKIRHRLRAVVAALDRMLEEAGRNQEERQAESSTPSSRSATRSSEI
jgi:hypothetical protein